MAGITLQMVRALVLKLIGGSPLIVSGTVMAEKLLLSKSLHMPKLDGLLGQAMSGGLGQIFENPLAAVAGDLGGAISGAVSNITGQLGDLAAPLVSALNGAAGLQGALSGLQGLTDALSGVALPDPAGFGLVDVISHASLAETFGAALPAAFGLDKVLAPFDMAADLAGMAASINSIAGQAIDGALTIDEAVAAIAGHATTLTGAVAGSLGALQGLQDAAVNLGTISAAASSFMSGPAPVQAFLGQVVRPAAASAMQAAIDEHMAV